MLTQDQLTHVFDRLAEALEAYDAAVEAYDDEAAEDGADMAVAVNGVMSSARFAVAMKDAEGLIEEPDEPATTAEVAAQLFRMAKMMALVSGTSIEDAARERIAWDREVADELERLLADGAAL